MESLTQRHSDETRRKVDLVAISEKCPIFLSKPPCQKTDEDTRIEFDGKMLSSK